jgi:hypothetical protein
VSGRPFELDLGVGQIAMRVGLCCALTAVTAVGAFFLLRIYCWIRLMLPTIFTLDIGGRPTLTFEAKNLREAWQLCHERWLREDVARLTSNGAALWDGKAALRSRYASENERAAYLDARIQPGPDELALAYLVELDAA